MEATQRNAFEHVFDRYRKALRVFFERRTACRSEAEDLVQDVFVRLVAQRDPAAMERNGGIDQLAPKLAQALERALFVNTGQPGIARHIGREDSGKLPGCAHDPSEPAYIGCYLSTGSARPMQG